MKKITLKSSFEEILGKNISVFTEKERKQRWNEWKQLAIKEGSTELVELWETSEGCDGCKHFNTKENWCNSQSLPCAVNPILSFQKGIIGMACMGVGFTKNN